MADQGAQRRQGGGQGSNAEHSSSTSHFELPAQIPIMSSTSATAPAAPPVPLSRAQQSRLMAIWRSGGWPCKDAVEIDLLARAWVALSVSASGHETLQLTPAGLELLGQARQRQRRAASAHDRLAERVAIHLMDAGRIVWRELSFRAQFQTLSEALADGAVPASALPMALQFSFDAPPEQGDAAPAKASWRVARPDIFSVRNTSVEAYLQPTVHEIKVSRADLLSDLRHAAKRESYQWLSCECTYVFPAGLAEPQELPEELGIWVVHGDVDTGRLELLRPARHVPRQLPFAVWMALAKATPVPQPIEPQQGHLGQPAEGTSELSAHP